MNLRRVSGDESSADFYFVIFCKSRTRSFARVRAAFLIRQARYTETVAADDREVLFLVRLVSVLRTRKSQPTPVATYGSSRSADTVTLPLLNPFSSPHFLISVTR